MPRKSDVLLSIASHFEFCIAPQSGWFLVLCLATLITLVCQSSSFGCSIFSADMVHWRPGSACIGATSAVSMLRISHESFRYAHQLMLMHQPMAALFSETVQDYRLFDAVHTPNFIETARSVSAYSFSQSFTDRSQVLIRQTTEISPCMALARFLWRLSPQATA